MVAPPHSPMGARAPPTTKMLMGNPEICVANSAFKKQENGHNNTKNVNQSSTLFSIFGVFFTFIEKPWIFHRHNLTVNRLIQKTFMSF